MTGLITGTVDPDVALRVSRRIDWRFLLPSPRLGRVGYLGRMDGHLLSALAVFADEVVVDPEAFVPASLDGVVAHGPSRRHLDLAAATVRPGGYLVAEVHGPSLPVALGAPPAGLAGVRSRWTSAGVRDMRAYWLLPDRGRCTMMIDLDDPAMVLAALGRNQGSASGRRKEVIGRRLQAIGLLRRIAPAVTVVAVKESSP
jgi:hypothetical protein